MTETAAGSTSMRGAIKRSWRTSAQGKSLHDIFVDRSHGSPPGNLGTRRVTCVPRSTGINVLTPFAVNQILTKLGPGTRTVDGMNKHLKRWSIAFLIVLTVCAIGALAFAVTSSMSTALLVSLFLGVCILYTHITTIARDMSARAVARKS